MFYYLLTKITSYLVTMTKYSYKYIEETKIVNYTFVHNDDKK